MVDKISETIEYLTVKEAAAKWGYCDDTIRKWCREGKIKVTIEAEKINNRWQIPISAECPKKVKV